MQLFGIDWVGVNADNGRKLVLSVVFVAVVLLTSALLRWLIGVLGQRDYAAAQTRFWARQGINLVAAIVLILGLLSIWFNDPARLSTAFGLMSAGLAFALQQVITAFAGYFVILRGSTFTVGDRISMGGVRGDVLRLGFIQTTIMEMGQPPSVQGADPAMWVKSRQFTGRIVTVSNAKIFAEPVFNYSRDFPFIWEEMAIPITYQADRARAEAILLEAARQHGTDPAAMAGDAKEDLQRRFGVEPVELDPRVYYRITDNWLELTVRFIVGTHRIRGAKDAMSRAIISELDQAGIGIASATYDIVGFPAPAPVLARRTSPTNIGLYLLSAAAAHDFGWLGLTDTVERLEATLATMARLSRFRGHFYNWYDTSDLRPLEPLYVSTVDSGNLAGHLIALANACGHWRVAALDVAAYRAGLADTASIVEDEVARLSAAGAPPPGLQDIGIALAAIRVLLAQAPSDDRNADLAKLSAKTGAVAAAAKALASKPDAADLAFWVDALHRSIESHSRDQVDLALLAPRLSAIEQAARDMALATEFGFLRNAQRKLLSIGFLPSEGTLDSNCYDLLASEARLACFVAIAKGDIPAREWFRLGRAVTPLVGGAVLVSWSGSMFEYLMPSLVMRAPDGSLLEDTSELVVRRQVGFGTEQGIPWGVSESAYNVRDVEYTYQYSNFGIPDLGLKRGLDADLVIAPYATALAAMVDPAAAVGNLFRIAGAGGQGRYGFYERWTIRPPEFRPVRPYRW